MIMSNKTYDTLKIVKGALAALATLYLTFGTIWTGIIELPYPEQVAASITAIITFLEALMYDSSKKYAKRVNGDYDQEEG